MNQICSVGLALLIFLQLINISIELIRSSSLCQITCSSTIFGDDWVGERLKFTINNGDSNETQLREVGVSFENSGTTVNFTCTRRKDVKTENQATITFYPDDKVTLVDSTAIYLNDNHLWCDWTINRQDNSTFPLELIKPGVLTVTPTEYKVTINLNDTLPIPKLNLSSLPDPLIEQYKDYQLIGNSRYLLFTKVTDRINYALVVNYEEGMRQLFPSTVTVNLDDSIYGLTVNCDFDSLTVDGQLLFVGKQFWHNNSYYYKQLSDNRIINETICEWSIPERIEYGTIRGYLDVKSRPFDLSIISDKRFKVLTQSRVKYTSSATGLTSTIVKPFIAFVLIVINQFFRW